LPELPEVDHLRRTLHPHLVGARVVAVKLRRRDIVVRCASRTGRLSSKELLAETTIAAILRHGKNLALVSAEGPALGIHLGMSGHLRFVPAGKRLSQADHVHCEWRLSSKTGEGRLIFRDPRRFGGIWTFPSLELLKSHLWQRLGPDAISIDAKTLSNQLKRTSRPIKSALLDQRVLAGVGNIYADESLFSAGIHPLSRANRLRTNLVESLSAAIQTVLIAAIDAGGSSIRSYADANGARGNYAKEHLVYGRAGEPCPNCGKPLAHIRVSQRTTTFCKFCQRR
jgi:formamidopyrimidine-DNA glycosylase